MTMGGLRPLALLLAFSAQASAGPSPQRADTPVPLSGSVVDTTFRATDEEIANPERGMYVWAADNLAAWTQAQAHAQFAAGYRIVYAPVRLGNHAGGPLPGSVLAGLSENFATARRAGLKVIPRFLYNYPAGETGYQAARDAPLGRVLGHIAQLGPALAANADVITYPQAGFVGAWGEWHTSSNNLTEPAPRTRIRDALLGALPPGRFLQVRYPPYLMAWAPKAPRWRDGSAASRIGVHNDCFLASNTDVGTYSEDAAVRRRERGYVAALSAVAPFGGETCNPADAVDPTPRTDCDDILREGRQFGLTYLNDSYYRGLFHARWEAQGCMAEVRRRMGYRFELVTLRHSAAIVAGRSGGFALTVRNSGWARAFNPRGVQVVLRHRATGEAVRITLASIDPRTWLPGRTSKMAASLAIPPGTPAGTYDVLLALPDGAPSLAGDVRYSVRPANAADATRSQGWDEKLGAFRAGTTLAILAP
ncbi:DUF4832 domain-containing protein [Pseudoduganella sp. SL102]|uniref:DUF4832 domain-containing protein n=1 Tax=Pseudoduganella sp. SL102 TaxID=2995154 RepID=UPI00248BEF47|nr:DUF4832 domain-containing protein [Pseudoduganella sp. SL102]WBS01140.1 DUF4832 domain-containing protein [Pseudoduganella sp. SL102]